MDVQESGHVFCIECFFINIRLDNDYFHANDATVLTFYLTLYFKILYDLNGFSI
jgi:hypothetical protein